MEMRITIVGGGFALGKAFGFNVLSYAYIETRPSKGFIPCTYGITKGPGIGSKSGTLIAGYAQTDWFRVDPSTHTWISQQRSLVGKTANLEVSGTMLKGGRVDIKFELVNGDGEATPLLSRVQVKSDGFQIADIKVFGVIQYLPNLNCDCVGA